MLGSRVCVQFCVNCCVDCAHMCSCNPDMSKDDKAQMSNKSGCELNATIVGSSRYIQSVPYGEADSLIVR